MLDGSREACFTFPMFTRRQVVALWPTGADAARAIGITRQAIQQWKRSDRPIPAERCAAIEAATGGRVTRAELRPDIFGPVERPEGAAGVLAGPAVLCDAGPEA